MTPPARWRGLRERTPLRTQLIVVTVALAALAVVVVAVVSTFVLRSYLIERADRQLEASIRPMSAGEFGDPRNQMDHGRNDFVPPAVYFGQVYDAQGNVVANLGPGGADDFGQPALPVLDARTVATLDGRPFTVSGEGGDWRVLVSPVDNPMTPQAAAVAIGLPLDGVQSTVNRLLLVDAAVAVAVLIALALAARWLVAVSLRPLGEIERTAHSIAAGDLTGRIDNVVPDTEVGRLGASLNAMLERIEAAFTAQLRSELAARSSEDQMRRLVADASHELRTPLTTIRGYAELYRQGATTPDLPADEVMRRIEATAARMGVLVDDLLLLARLDQHRSLQQVPVDLQEIVIDVLHEMAPVAPGHRLHMEPVGGGPVTVLGDADRLRQVVSNLVANAVRHTPAGTEVSVTLTETAAEVTLEVADSGPGMPPESASRAFERFYRADASRSRADSGSGTGLGLAIVEALVEAHGGTVTLSSTLGQGTTVVVTLPKLPA